VAKGLPVFVSEFGICDASGNGGIDEESADTWISLLNRLNISYVAWNLSNKNETSALIDSGCSKTYGWSYDELSASGKWLFNMLNSGSEYTAWENDSQEIKSDSDTDRTQSSVKNTDDTQQGNTQPQNELSSENINADTTQEQTDIPAISHSLSDSYDMQLRTSWNNNGENYYLYDLTIYNKSDKAVNGWSISIDFEKNMVLSDSWCGIYQMNGSSLSISSMDYNGAIPAGGSISNVGFIVHD
jgi:endoglucanase